MGELEEKGFGDFGGHFKAELEVTWGKGFGIGGHLKGELKGNLESALRENWRGFWKAIWRTIGTFGERF